MRVNSGQPRGRRTVSSRQRSRSRLWCQPGRSAARTTSTARSPRPNRQRRLCQGPRSPASAAEAGRDLDAAPEATAGDGQPGELAQRLLRLDNFSVRKGDDVRAWAAANNVELAYTPRYASWLNRIEPQFKGLRYFCLDGTDHPDHATQARLIADYIHWRNAHRNDPKLRHLTRRILAPKAAPRSTRQTLPDLH